MLIKKRIKIFSIVNYMDKLLLLSLSLFVLTLYIFSKKITIEHKINISQALSIFNLLK
jgi:hypothetical protein